MAVIDNLVSYWSLEEASGARDDAHSTHNLTDNNTVTSATGKVGTAASFAAATTESLSVADHADFSGPGDLSIALWVRPTTGGAATDRRLVTKDNVNDQREWSLFLSNSSGPSWQIFDSVSGLSTAEAAAIPSDSSTWTFLIATYTASDMTPRLYVNNGTVNAGSALSNALKNTTAAVYLGTASDGAYQPHDGLLDEVGIWRKVLTSDERTWLYNSGSGRSYADIVAEGSPGASSGGAFPRWRSVRR
jgi:hypothetical protein